VAEIPGFGSVTIRSAPCADTTAADAPSARGMAVARVLPSGMRPFPKPTRQRPIESKEVAARM